MEDLQFSRLAWSVQEGDSVRQDMLAGDTCFSRNEPNSRVSEAENGVGLENDAKRSQLGRSIRLPLRISDSRGHRVQGRWGVINRAEQSQFSGCVDRRGAGFYAGVEKVAGLTAGLS